MIEQGLDLIRLAARAAEPFVTMLRGRTPDPPTRNRAAHAASLLNQVDALSNAIGASTSQPLGDATGVSVAVEGVGIRERAESLADKRSGVSLLDIRDDVAIIRVPRDLNALRRKIDAYARQDTSRGKPKNQPLVARVVSVRLATLEDLSLGELNAGVLEADQMYWVELWAAISPDASDEGRVRTDAAIAEFASMADSGWDPPVFRGPERDIHLVHVSGALLSQVPELLPDVAEVHLAARISSMVIAEALDDQGEVLDVEPPDGGAAVVAVLDSGISPIHPYLQPLLLGLDSAVPGANAIDAHGHGTLVAGLAAYRNLAGHLAAGTLVADAWLVSIRLLEIDADQPGGDEERGVLWAARSELAVQQAEALAGGRPIVFNISLGAPNPGSMRTAWSIALDELAWNAGAGRLVVVAGGNVDPDIVFRPDFPDANLGSPHDQPGQAWNVTTVGGITEFDELSPEDVGLGAPPPLAQAGQLSPFTSTAVGGNRPLKPELAEEAGNTAPGGGLANKDLQGLSLLSTGRPSGTTGRLVRRAHGTSASAALVSNALARVYSEQTHLRPATIRGLLANAARWPEPALQQLQDTRDVLRSIGLGVPSAVRAASSDSNRPVMVYEGALRPSQRRSGGGFDRSVEFIEVPFPMEIAGIGDEHVTLSVTLSYFVEPTASLARREYAGARLRWDMQGPTESADGFRARINRLVRDSGVDAGSGSFDWKIGPQIRSRGTLQQDRTQISASALAGGRLIAVYPVTGWWDDLRDGDRSLPFSLIVSADLADVDIDLYTLVMAELEVVLDVDA